MIEQAIKRQNELLPGVSRTFALTIPQLPKFLEVAITNAYLLCRIADTIEDDLGLSIKQKQEFHKRFTDIVANGESIDSSVTKLFATELGSLLSSRTIEAERILVAETPLVVQVTHSLNEAQKKAIIRCVKIMCGGMPDFQSENISNGLNKMRDMDRYCYYVAGVVGEMLTELFCDYSREINENKETFMNLSTSFGQGLQMTNILKDVWDDQLADVCWLPQEIFDRHGFQLNKLSPDLDNQGFSDGVIDLIGIARSHLANALKYTTLIPQNETGIRRFCFWAIGMSLLTLRNIHKNPTFVSSQEVKISRRKVKATVLATSLFCRSNRAIGLLFKMAEKGLPEKIDLKPPLVPNLQLGDLKKHLPQHDIVSSETEHLVLVDKDDNELGSTTKEACHNGDGMLHRAFSLFVFNDRGELLLQQRSKSKRLWPLYWSNSCCSHPRLGETMNEATQRRIHQELGVNSDNLQYLYKFHYQAKYGSLGSEHELCSVYIGSTTDEVAANINEVADCRFVSVSQLQKEVSDSPESFTPWFKMELQHLLQNYASELAALGADVNHNAFALEG